MSTISVNTIEPTTEARVNFTGLNAPSFQGSELAVRNQVLPLVGGTMTGAITLPGNAASPLHVVPLQQVAALTNAAYPTRVGAMPGYISFPNAPIGMGPPGPALIIQWASVTLGDTPSGTPGTVSAVTWPIPFLSQCLTVQATVEVTPGALNNVAVGIIDRTTTDATFQVQEWSAGVNSVTVHFLAIGV